LTPQGNANVNGYYCGTAPTSLSNASALWSMPSEVPQNLENCRKFIAQFSEDEQSPDIPSSPPWLRTNCGVVPA
jgi:hypothetical protein